MLDAELVLLRYKPTTEPNGFISMMTPVQYDEGAYQHPSKAARVTGLPTIKISLLRQTLGKCVT